MDANATIAGLGSNLVTLDPMLAQFGGYIVIVAALVLISILAWVIVNSRYPRKRFEVYESSGFREICWRRSVNGKVVSNNLVEILLKGNNILGMALTDYPCVKEGKREYYVGWRKGGEIVPAVIQDGKISVAEIGTARDIAIRYVNVIDSTKQDLDKQNPILLALVSVLPLGVLVLLTGVMMYLILSNALPAVITVEKDISKMQLETVQALKDVSANLAALGGHTAAPAATNSTVYIPVPRGFNGTS
jgi:hypothetical protein